MGGGSDRVAMVTSEHLVGCYMYILHTLSPCSTLQLVSGDEFKVSGACLGLMGYNRNSAIGGVVRDDSTRKGYLLHSHRSLRKGCEVEKSE